MSDIKKLIINSTEGTKSDGPKINFEIQLSDEFSNLNSLQLLYWLVNNQQTWIAIPRDDVTGEFKTSIDIGEYAQSGTYSIRSINITTNNGTFLNYNEGQLSELGFQISTNVANINSDNQKPQLSTVEILGSSFDVDGSPHIQVQVKASDDKSGLVDRFILEFLSPTGNSIQQWCLFDSNGESTVDFTLSKYSASGNYSLNTVRIADAAGNNEMSQSFLSAHPVIFNLNNINSDNLAPELAKFNLTASYDPLTNRPQIDISGLVTDLVSGVKGIYIRLTSPTGRNLDEWVYYGNSPEVNFKNYIALPIDFTPGEYKVDFLRLSDIAGNETTWNSTSLFEGKFQNSIRIYFENSNNESKIISNPTDLSGYIFGSDLSNDSLSSGKGDDYLYAGSGNDIVNAGDGNDLIIAGSGAGDDTYNGEVGVDTIKYTSAKSGIIINLSEVSNQAHGILPGDVAGIGIDQISNIENIISGNFNDILTGDANDNYIDGESGDDTITGGLGKDALNGGPGADSFKYNSAQDSFISGYDIINDFTNIDKITLNGISGIKHYQGNFQYYGDFSTTLKNIINDTTIENKAVFFTDGTDGFFYIKGSGSGVDFNGTLIKILNQTSPPLNNQLAGIGGYEVNATAFFWKNAFSSLPATKLSGVTLSAGGINSTSDSTGLITLSGVDDTQGSDDGFMALTPQLVTATTSKNAITLTDVLATLKVYLNKPLPEAYASPLNYIAADFDGSGTVTLSDVLQLLKYYLNKSTTVTPTWQFVDAADMSIDGKTFAGANGANLAKDNAIPHAIDQTFDATHTSIELVGVLRGDVDGSWSPP